VRWKRLAAAGELPLGIALHAGQAIVGNVGSAERKEYTVIGDVVNVALPH
jgi:adenylate cyclase